MQVILPLVLVLGILSEPLLACRLYGICAKPGLTISTLTTSEQSIVLNQFTAFFNQSVLMSNGWAFMGYQVENPDSLGPIYRSDSPATEDSTTYWNSVSTLMNDNEYIIGIGHLRLATSGDNTVPNPHPFLFYENGISYSLIHHGTVNKDLLYDLITNNGTNISWLDEHEPQTFGGGPWQGAGWSNVVDSELLMLYIMQNIDSEGSIIDGLEKALSTLVDAGVPNSELNLIFSNGNDLYVFGGENGLSIAESEEHYAVMTLPPSNDGLNWVGISHGDLIVINNDGITYYPGIAGTYPEDPPIVPIEEFLIMLPAYPNPFNGSIAFDLMARSSEFVNYSIFNLTGKLIYSRKFQIPNTGLKKVMWNVKSQNNQNISSGTYILKVSTNNKSKMQKVVYIK
jgi:hypothetical protein